MRLATMGSPSQFGMPGNGSVTADLKDPDDLARIKALVEQSDVVVEQFRPGVMSRLGLGYEQFSETAPGLVYCSITGFGQDGPKAMVRRA